MDALAAGCIIAVLARERGGLQRLQRWARPSCLAGTGVILATIAITGKFVPTNPFVQTLGLSISALVASALVVMAISLRPTDLLARLLCHPVPTRLGTYSYATYIVHQPLQLVLNKLGLTYAALAPHFSSRLSAQLAYSFILMAAAISLGALSWHGFERHVLKLKKYFPNARPAPRTDSREAPAAASAVKA
jgi:peptidoglycan/LPS O-acetylase OafA/YrhL